MQRHGRRGPLRLDRFELETFGERLQLALRRREMSAVQLAKLIHADNAMVSKYVRDECTPHVDTLIDIADALDISMDWLCGRKPRDREIIYR